MIVAFLGVSVYKFYGDEPRQRSLMRLGLGACSGCIAMAAESWTHQIFIWTWLHYWNKLVLYSLQTASIKLLLHWTGASGCFYMAVRSWSHQTLLRTCIGRIFTGKGPGLYVWAGHLLKAQFWFISQTQRD
ncbi:hypothetical protein HanRHA438_Chr11g0514631 [Helianthus annuus]|uniref:Uncharacterized protein n=1 Tax=Helianthus annuus TaxID=4232 RepID=A0A251TCP7_HELAN|nr:hypothetical protein HanIR_Chr11g0540451 [Helianthus annuus]KAJ0871625.1 hypothetical protein HanRHA438_Chr11g0514631 [Helianthus annuus]